MVPVSPLVFGEGIVSLNNVATPPLTSVKKKTKKKKGEKKEKNLQQPPHTSSQQSKANWHVDLEAQLPSQTYSCASEILCNISYVGPLSRLGWIPCISKALRAIRFQVEIRILSECVSYWLRHTAETPQWDRALWNCPLRLHLHQINTTAYVCLLHSNRNRNVWNMTELVVRLPKIIQILLLKCQFQKQI